LNKPMNLTTYGNCCRSGLCPGLPAGSSRRSLRPPSRTPPDGSRLRRSPLTRLRRVVPSALVPIAVPKLWSIQIKGRRPEPRGLLFPFFFHFPVPRFSDAFCGWSKGVNLIQEKDQNPKNATKNVLWAATFFWRPRQSE